MPIPTEGRIAPMPRADWTPAAGPAFAIVGRYVLTVDPAVRCQTDQKDADEIARRWNAHDALVGSLRRVIIAERAARAEWMAAITQANALLDRLSSSHRSHTVARCA